MRPTLISTFLPTVLKHRIATYLNYDDVVRLLSLLEEEEQKQKQKQKQQLKQQQQQQQQLAFDEFDLQILHPPQEIFFSQIFRSINSNNQSSNNNNNKNKNNNNRERIPILFHQKWIHSIRITCQYKDQGYGERLGRILVVKKKRKRKRKKKKSSSSSSSKEKEKEEINEEEEEEEEEEVVYISPPAPHYQYENLEIIINQPLTTTETETTTETTTEYNYEYYYELQFHVGNNNNNNGDDNNNNNNNDGRLLFVEDLQITTIVFDNSSSSCNNNNTSLSKIYKCLCDYKFIDLEEENEEENQQQQQQQQQNHQPNLVFGTNLLLVAIKALESARNCLLVRPEVEDDNNNNNNNYNINNNGDHDIDMNMMMRKEQQQQQQDCLLLIESSLANFFEKYGLLTQTSSLSSLSSSTTKKKSFTTTKTTTTTDFENIVRFCHFFLQHVDNNDYRLLHRHRLSPKPLQQEEIMVIEEDIPIEKSPFFIATVPSSTKTKTKTKSTSITTDLTTNKGLESLPPFPLLAYGSWEGEDTCCCITNNLNATGTTNRNEVVENGGGCCCVIQDICLPILRIRNKLRVRITGQCTVNGPGECQFLLVSRTTKATTTKENLKTMGNNIDNLTEAATAAPAKKPTSTSQSSSQPPPYYFNNNQEDDNNNINNSEAIVLQKIMVMTIQNETDTLDFHFVPEQQLQKNRNNNEVDSCENEKRSYFLRLQTYRDNKNGDENHCMIEIENLMMNVSIIKGDNNNNDDDDDDANVSMLKDTYCNLQKCGVLDTCNTSGGGGGEVGGRQRIFHLSLLDAVVGTILFSLSTVNVSNTTGSSRSNNNNNDNDKTMEGEKPSDLLVSFLDSNGFPINKDNLLALQDSLKILIGFYCEKESANAGMMINSSVNDDEQRHNIGSDENIDDDDYGTGRMIYWTQHAAM